MMETGHHHPGAPPPQPQPRGPHQLPPHEENVGAGLAIAQFVVTGVLLGLVATLAYLAGMRSAGKEGGGESSAASAGHAGSVDVAELLEPTPALVAKGKALYAVNCASCHGPQGFGDGPAAVALNPKPRNYHEGYWKYGGGVARIVQTISTGSPGTAMAAFTNIPLEDRFALAHFVRSFSPKPEADKPEDLAWLGPIGRTTGGASGGAGPGGAQKASPTIPIELALHLMEEPSPQAGVAAAPLPVEGPGAAIYAERCASCHGGSGEGGVRVRMLGSAPYAYVTTEKLSAGRGGWSGDPARFERLILEGIPGYLMPGNGDLSREDLRELYQFTTTLRSSQSGTTNPGASPAPSPAPAGANRS